MRAPVVHPSRLVRPVRRARPVHRGWGHPRGGRRPDRWVEADDGARIAAWVREPARPPRPSWPERLRQRPAAPVTVVLVHGWTLAAQVWDRVVADLVARRPDVRVVTYDQRGHGASSRGSGATGGGAASISRLADDLDQVVRALAPTGPLVLAGHSMGGMAVLAAAGRHPELLGPRTRGVLLLSTSAGGLAAAGRRLVPLMAALARMPEGLVVPRAPRRLLQRANYGPGADPRLVAETSRALGRVSGRSTGEWFGALMAHDETAALSQLAATGVPVRVLVGDADRLTPPVHAEAIAAALPRAELQVVPGTGHMLLVERPDVVAGVLDQLLTGGRRTGASQAPPRGGWRGAPRVRDAARDRSS